MNIQDQYSTIVQPSPFIMREYRTPQQYLDPGKIIEQKKNMNYKKRSQGKFKPSKRQKQFFIDELIQPIKSNPAPSNYKVELDLLQAKSKSSKVNNALKPDAIKNTYIDQIQLRQKKQKVPGVGKYNLLKLSDFSPEKKHKRSSSKLNPQKRCYFDGQVIHTLTNPGPGQHNSKLPQKPLRPDTTDYKFYKEKHKQDEQKIKRSLSAKLGPTAYNPVHFNTFDSLKIKSKQPQTSRWTHGQIQIRKGLRSACKHPSPAQYQLINQWSPGKGLLARSHSLSNIGKIKLFERTIKTARSLSVYRD